MLRSHNVSCRAQTNTLGIYANTDTAAIDTTTNPATNNHAPDTDSHAGACYTDVDFHAGAFSHEHSSTYRHSRLVISLPLRSTAEGANLCLNSILS